MSAEDGNDFKERQSLSKLELDREHSEAIARYSGAADFTVVEAAFLLTGRDPIFWGAPSAKFLLSRKRYQKHFGNAVALFKEILKALDAKRLHATTRAFNGDGTYDPEMTRISRAELTSFANTCDIETVALPGTSDGPITKQGTDDATSLQHRRVEVMERTRGTKRAILEHWNEVVARHGPNADAAQVARILREHADRSERAPHRKTVHNRLGELRKEGVIP